MNKKLKSKNLEVLVDAQTLSVTVRDIRTSMEWRMCDDGPGDIGIKGHCGPWRGFAFKDAKNIEWDDESENRLVATATGWPYSANVWSPITFGLVVEFSLDADDLTISVDEHLPKKHEASIIDSHYPRAFLFPEKTDGNLVLPVGEGCLLNKKFNGALDLTLPNWIGLGFTMPWWGQLAENGAGFVATTDTPNDLAFRISNENGGGSAVHPYWQASLGGLKYKRSMKFSFFDKTSVVEMAKHYRRYANACGKGVTLREKAAERPAVNDLKGSVMLNVWMLSDFANFNQPGRVVFMKFTEAFRRYEYLVEKAGLKKVTAHIDGWCDGGYDFNHPDVLPPDIRIGGWEGLRAFTDKVGKLGHRVVLHDNYTDLYANAKAFEEDAAVLDLSGIHSESDEWLGGRQRWLCPTLAQRYTDRNFDEIQKKAVIDGLYLDCWSIGHLRECFDQQHLSNRKTTRASWSAIFADCQKRGWLVGSESGNDWAVPFMDYCWELQVGVTPHILANENKAFGIPIPLYSLVWSDCLISHAWITENSDENGAIMEGATANQSVNAFLWGLLRGCAPTVRPECLDNPQKGGEGDLNAGVDFLRSLSPMTDLHEKTAFEEMTDWKLDAADGSAQTTEFANGTKVSVDFASNHFEVS